VSRNRVRAVVAAAALMASLFAVAPVNANQGVGLRIDLIAFEFTGATCDPVLPFCIVTTEGTATSNQAAGQFPVHSVLGVDFSLGGDCNEVDESIDFAFPQGSLFAHSHHVDCRVHGWRIKTRFEITGGTGAFAGASGGGLEMGVPPGIFYNGTISR
jgi:hypothetical protein